MKRDSSLASLLLAAMTAGAVMGCAGPRALVSGGPGHLAAPQTAAPPVATRLVDSGDAPTPPGFVSFCLRQPDQCRMADDPVTAVTLTEENWRAIQSINHAVNRSIWPQKDQRHYGRAEYWTIPDDGYGDCEDYALTKRRDLTAAGLPVAALRLAIVIAPRVGRHAVLTVSTDRGDYVLDSLRDDILPWSATGFVWIERQDARRPMAWTALDVTPRQFADAAPGPAGALPP